MSRWTDIVTVEPAGEPVCVDEVKHFARIDHKDDDAMLASFITTARAKVESYCKRAIITQTRALKADCFPGCSIIDEFRAPLASVSSVAYTDPNGAAQTMSSAMYQVDATSTPGRLGLLEGYSWPSTKPGIFNAVVITYVAGQAAASVPVALKEAIKRVVKAMFDGCSVDDAMDSGVLSLLADYRVEWPC